MKCIIQTVDSARVTYNGDYVSHIGKGIVIYVGVSRNEPEDSKEWLIQNILKLVSADDQILCLSQFTLFGAFKSGKASFHKAESNDIAKIYYEDLVDRLLGLHPNLVARGKFGHVLEIELKGSNFTTELIERPLPIQ